MTNFMEVIIAPLVADHTAKEYMKLWNGGDMVQDSGLAGVQRDKGTHMFQGLMMKLMSPCNMNFSNMQRRKKS